MKISPKLAPVGARCLVKFYSTMGDSLSEITIEEWSPNGNLKVKHANSQICEWIVKHKLPEFIERLADVKRDLKWTRWSHYPKDSKIAILLQRCRRAIVLNSTV